MLEPWLLEGKLAPPERPQPWIARAIVAPDRPLAPLTWLVGGPGTGKSLGLLALAERFAAPAGTVWLDLDAGDADPLTFFHYLVAGMRRLVPDFGAELLSLLPGAGADARPLWQRFFKDVAAYNPPGLLLAFDDAEGGPDHPLGALAYFADKLPPRVHVAIAARTRPGKEFTRARAAGKLAVLGPEDLAFTPAEVAAYLRAAAPAGDPTGDPTGDPPAGWAEAADGLDGWPLGVALVAREARPSREAIRESVSDFVMAAIYAEAPARLQGFLRQIAVLPEITADACRWAFGALDAGELLAELEAAQLATRLADGVTYRLPGYMREALLAEAARTVPEIERANWARRAAAWYRDQGREELALGLWIAARDWDEVALAAGPAFAAMRFSGRHAQIARMLAAVPAEVVAAEPALLVWRGHGLARAGKRDEAAAVYDEAARLFRRRDDGAGEFGVLVRQATLAMRRGDYARFNQLALQAMARHADGRPNDVADLQLARAGVADFRGDRALMRECNEAVLAVPPGAEAGADADLAASHVIAHLNLQTAAAQAGDLAAARAHAARALALAERFGFLPYRIYAGVLLANLDLVAGDAEGAAVRLRALPADWEALLDWHMKAVGHMVVGLAAGSRGEWAEAEAALGRAEATLQGAGYAEGLKVAAEAQLWLLIRQGKADKALARAGEALAGGPATGPATSPIRNYYDAAVALPAARALALAGRPGEAAARLGELVVACDELGVGLLAVRSRLYQAAAARAAGLPDAQALLADAEGRLDAGGWGFLRGEDAALWAELAPAPAPAPPAARKAKTAPLVPPAAGTPAGMPADRAAGAPAGAPAAAPATGRLELTLFGAFGVRVDGVRLDAWPRKKAKLLLAALALSPRGVTQATLAEWLGDGDPVSGLEILRVNLKTLRATLEPRRAKGQASAFVVGEGDRLRLDPAQLGGSDLTAFEAALAAADAIQATDPVTAAAHYAAAVALHRAPLLDEALLRDHFAPERARCQEKAADALDWLAGFHMGRGDLTEAEAALRHALTIIPTQESAYLALMRHLHAAGKPERARQVYWDCRYALKQHLDAAPSPGFEAAAQSLR